jgi:hypothetical protein
VAIVDLVAEESKHSDLNPTAGDANADHGYERIAARRPAAMSVGHKAELHKSPVRALAFDGEPDAFRRTDRPFLRGFSLPYNGALICPLDSITADDLVLVMSDGTRETWTRAPAE